MNRAPHIKRALLIVAVLLAAYAGLGWRLFQLHVIQAPTLTAEAEQNRIKQKEIPALRGEIRDARGELLARSISVFTVCADPSITSEKAHETSAQLASLLGIEVEDLFDKLIRTGRYVRLKDKVDGETVNRIKALKIKGLTYEESFIRVYPNGHLLAHVLGWTNRDHHGVAGIELTMDKYLHGTPGQRVIETDRRGRENIILRRDEIPVRHGDNVVLTINQVIQHILEKELDEAMETFKPKAAYAIVMRPATGEILGMSNRPTFDPNRFNKFTADQQRNRCVSDTAEPGSVYKIVPVAAGLNDGVVTLATRFDCENGAFQFGGRTLHDSHAHGILSVLEILTVSSNIGAAKVGIAGGVERLYRYIQLFGFGKKTGIELPGEVSGISHAPAKWSKVSLAQIPMGHGIAVTPIQMLTAMNAIANDGVLVKPTILKRVVDNSGKTVAEFTPAPGTRILSSRTASMMKTALKTVVLNKDQSTLDGSTKATQTGTAQKAALADWVVAGKTGTAWKVENGQYVRKYYSSFIGFLPADNPQLCIIVSIDEPQEGGYYGGTVAAPVFHDIAEKTAQYLQIPAVRKTASSLAATRRNP